MRNWLKWGDYNAICDSCGRKFKASMLQKRWDGLLVCQDDWEIKHPQLNVRIRGDKQFVPNPRPQEQNILYNHGDALLTENSTTIPANTIYITAEDLTPLYTEN
jgi:hypothetical protein